MYGGGGQVVEVRLLVLVDVHVHLLVLALVDLRLLVLVLVVAHVRLRPGVNFRRLVLFRRRRLRRHLALRH